MGVQNKALSAISTRSKKGPWRFIYKELSIDIPCPFYGLMCSIKPCNEKKKGFI